MNSFHEIVRNARKQQGFTQSELAELLDVTGAYIAKIEKGGSCPSPRFLARLCSQLALPMLDTFLMSLMENRFPDELKSALVDMQFQRNSINRDPDFRDLIRRLAAMSDLDRARIIQAFSPIMDMLARDTAQGGDQETDPAGPGSGESGTPR